MLEKNEYLLSSVRVVEVNFSVNMLNYLYIPIVKRYVENSVLIDIIIKSEYHTNEFPLMIYTYIRY